MNNQFNSADLQIEKIKCVVFDFGFTLSSELYFNVDPPGYPDWQKVIQQKIFINQGLVDEWMKGKIALTDIAKILSTEFDLDILTIIKFLQLGCENLEFNPAVLEFALSIKAQGVKTAIVTGNMDVFTQVVVPSHHLDRKFDVILNSFDFRELDKKILWSKAFDLLGNGIEYRNSLLIEDCHKNVNMFRNCGGFAYEYKNDEFFTSWLEEIGWKNSSEKHSKTLSE